MKTNQALKIIGGLSRPSKMPGWSYGLPAKECKTGSKLRKVKDSVCYNCYALKGCYVFKVVQAAQYRRLDSIKNPGWVSATFAGLATLLTYFISIYLFQQKIIFTKMLGVILTIIGVLMVIV